MSVKYLHSLTGPVKASELGLILPTNISSLICAGHLRLTYAQADANDVIRLMKPYWKVAWNAGATAFVECTPPGCRAKYSCAPNTWADVTPIRILIQQVFIVKHLHLRLCAI